MQRLRLCLQTFPQHGNTRTSQGRNGINAAAFQATTHKQGRDFGASLRQTLGEYPVCFGQRHHAPFQPKQIEDVQVLARLRHGAVVRRHRQQHEIDTGGARQHVVDEFLVAWHIHEAEHVAIGQGRVGVAQVNGDAPRFLFLEAVCIHAGQGFDQRGFAMVDVTCAADNQKRKDPS